MHKNPVHGSRDRRGFTLVELLVVMGIIVLLMGLTVPAIQALASSGGRAGALNTIMNTFTQAHAAALEASTDVFVVFADRNHPDVEKRYRAFMVMRRYESALDPNKPAGTRYVPLSKWQFLPRGIAFATVESSIVNAVNMTSLDLNSATDSFLAKGSGIPPTLPYVQYTGAGIIRQPANTTDLKLFIYEGFWDGTKDVATSSDGKLLDQISLSRFTGRAQLDISSDPRS